MALFTDGPVADAEELLRYEASVGDVANAEGVSVSTKIALAQEECGSAVVDFLRQNLAYAGVVTDALLARVVVDARLRRWVALRALWALFRDVYTRQLNDRYAVKREEYASLMKEARDSYFANGVGLVNTPVPQAAAPVLAAIAGTGPTGTVYAAVTAVDAQGHEGAASAVSALTLTTGHTAQVTFTGTGNWNLYLGLSPELLTLQNATPLSQGQWVLNGAPTVGGASAPLGQRADVMVRWRRLLRRG